MGSLKSDLSSLCWWKWASMRGSALNYCESHQVRDSMFSETWVWKLMWGVIPAPAGFGSCLELIPGSCREPIRSAQVVAHLAKCENYFFSGNLVSKALGGEKKSSSSGVARCIFPLWTCSKFCTWMNTVLLGFTLVFPCLPPCTYPTHPFLLNLIQGCSFSVACECDEVTFSEL